MLSKIYSSIICESKSEAIISLPLSMDLLDQIGDDRYKRINSKNLGSTGFAFGSSYKPGSPASLRSASYDPSLNFSNTLLFEVFLGCSH